MIWFRDMVLGLALFGVAIVGIPMAALGCGLLASAAQDPNLQAFVFKQITDAMSDTLEDRLENVPFTLDYDHSTETTRTDGTVRDGEHVWMVTVKDKDLVGVFDE